MQEIEKCEVKHVHEDTVREVLESQPREDQLDKLADLYKMLGDPTRIKILNALWVSELCVCDLTAILGLNQSAVSHQLRLLKSASLVKYRREGRVVFYSLDDEHVQQIYSMGLLHIQEE